MAASSFIPKENSRPVGPSNPTALFGNPATFTAAANTQASDYDRIMKSYGDIISSTSESPTKVGSISPTSVQPFTNQFQDINPSQTRSSGSISPSSVRFSDVGTPSNISSNSLTPQQANYEQSADVTKSLEGLGELASTGGYNAAGIADLRARGIAPTRSIYANAQQNIERQRALGGGYSPNFNAAQSQLARDESSQIGDITTNVNAGIAQNVASNRIAAASPYASASASANAARTAADQRNVDIVNQINELNERNRMQTEQANREGQMRTNEFNAMGRSRTDEANANRAMEASRFNIENTGRINEANAGRQMEAARFNAEGRNRTNTLNAGIAEANANRSFDASKFNVDAAMRAQQGDRGNILAATEGMRGLYGTTPALTNTFGNQVVQAGQLGQGQQQLDQQKQRDIFGSVTGW